MRKVFEKIFIGVFVLVLLLPTISLAGLKLEQNYPSISGITGQSESLNTAVSQTAKNAPTNTVSLIRYLFTLTIIVLIGLATLALIIAGVQYLSSAGKVTAQKAARTRLLKAFIGLAIVVGASLILQIISPSLDIPELTHIYNSNSNVILISEVGMNGDGGLRNADITKEYLDKLADQGLIKYFGSQSGDLTQSFGQLTKYTNSPNVSFADFQPKYVGFFGKGKNNIQVKTFSGTNFLGTGNTYKAETGGTDAGGIGSEKIIYFSLPTYPATASNVDWFDTTVGNPDESQPASKSPSKYPPLSMAVEGISGGVYLYGWETQMPASPADQPDISGDVDTGESIKFIGGKGGQRFLQFDIPNFSDTSFDFDNEAMEIEIKNNRQADPSAQDDLLVFLFEQPYYQGPFRAFFEEKKDLPRAKIYSDYDDTNNKSWFEAKITQTIIDAYIGKPFLINMDLTASNNPPLRAVAGLKIDVNSMDKQGKVFGVSSARVFHLAEFDIANKKYKSTCQAVALCGAVSLQGYCLVFTPTGKSNGAWMSVFLPMPWFEPIAIPKELPKELQNAMLADPDQKKAFDKEKDFREFNDNIDSIGIKGDCVVALYENSFKLTDANYWDSDTPGEKSMVFSKSDMVSGNIEGYGFLNLKNYQINSCVSLASALRLTPPHSCVSAVAVYPVK